MTTSGPTDRPIMPERFNSTSAPKITDVIDGRIEMPKPIGRVADSDDPTDRPVDADDLYEAFESLGPVLQRHLEDNITAAGGIADLDFFGERAAVEVLRSAWFAGQVAAAKAEAVTRAADEIEQIGREQVAWLAKYQEDAVDRARLIGSEDAYKDSVSVLRERAVVLAPTGDNQEAPNA